MVQRYRSRLSGPLLDRIDLQVLVPAVRWQELSSDRRRESTLTVAARVEAARDRQVRRMADAGIRCNCEMGPQEMTRWAQPDDEGRRLLGRAVEALGLSARAYHRLLRVARTIADLAASECVRPPHVAEAIAYRVLDRDAACG